MLAWQRFGLQEKLGARIVSYADDLVILCRRGRADEALQHLRRIVAKLKLTLTLNEDKTRTCQVPQETFDFLGYTFGRLYSMKTGQARLGMRPSKKSIRRMVKTIHALTAYSMSRQESTWMVETLNRKLRGWANYFSVGTVSRSYRARDTYTATRLRRRLRHKHKARRKRRGSYPLPYLYEHLELIQLTTRERSEPWAKA